jgi:hypothetical protein
MPALGAKAVLGKMVQNRQRERRRLAGARLRDANEIAAREYVRDGFRLDRGRGFVFFVFESLRDGRGKAEVLKRGQWSNFLQAIEAGESEWTAAAKRGVVKDIPRGWVADVVRVQRAETKSFGFNTRPGSA